MRVLVCGSRDWGTRIVGGQREIDPTTLEFQMLDAMIGGIYQDHMIGYDVVHCTPFTIIEGGATGADAIANWWARCSPLHSYEPSEFQHECYPADWDKYGKAAGPIRNQQMLDTGVDLVVACSNNLATSRGTKHMVSIAEKAGINIVLLACKPSNTQQKLEIFEKM